MSALVRIAAALERLVELAEAGDAQEVLAESVALYREGWAMAEQSTYPQCWLDPRTGTHLRYNSASFVCTVSQGQLQVQHLGEHPHLLHSAQAVASTAQAFLAAYDDTCERLLALGLAVPGGQVLYQRRGHAPDTWYCRQEGSQQQSARPPGTRRRGGGRAAPAKRGGAQL